ncbi:MAG: hypothetical protein QNJ29_10745 [Rhizobiaceae bacterium]|nr:hypothetical protein [Rhizobiaceae bacterium]
MTMLIIQSLLLMAIAYILGCLIGGLLRYPFSSEPTVEVAKPQTRVPAPSPSKPEQEPEQKKSEPVKPKPTPEPKPVPAPVQKDDLKRIKGIGPQNEARLNSAGVYSFAEIAQWSADEQRDMGERLAFPGRIEREDWVEQAKILAKGDETEFAKRVDKGEVDSSVGKGAADDMGSKPPVLDAAPSQGSDNLTLIGGIGGAIERKLTGMGIHTFEQISNWTKEEQAWISNELGFPGRVEREAWVENAKVLAGGGATEHSKKVERGEILTSRKF